MTATYSKMQQSAEHFAIGEHDIRSPEMKPNSSSSQKDATPWSKPFRSEINTSVIGKTPRKTSIIANGTTGRTQEIRERSSSLSDFGTDPPSAGTVRPTTTTTQRNDNLETTDQASPRSDNSNPVDENAEDSASQRSNQTYDSEAETEHVQPTPRKNHNVDDDADITPKAHVGTDSESGAKRKRLFNWQDHNTRRLREWTPDLAATLRPESGENQQNDESDGERSDKESDVDDEDDDADDEEHVGDEGDERDGEEDERDGEEDERDGEDEDVTSVGVSQSAPTVTRRTARPERNDGPRDEVPYKNEIMRKRSRRSSSPPSTSLRAWDNATKKDTGSSSDEKAARLSPAERGEHLLHSKSRGQTSSTHRTSTQLAFEQSTETIDQRAKVDGEVNVEAIKTFASIMEQFVTLRTSMHADRIADAEAELVLLRQPHSSHTEYIRQLQAVTHRRDTKIQQEMRLLQYRKQALSNFTLGTRGQLFSQYMQDARDIRDRALSDLGKQSYDIQRHRRAEQMDELDRYAIRFPPKRSTRIRHQIKYNLEVSILSGVAKYVGFPAAPDLSFAKPDELDNDLRAMNIEPRSRLVSIDQTRSHVLKTTQLYNASSPTISAKTPFEHKTWPSAIQTNSTIPLTSVSNNSAINIQPTPRSVPPSSTSQHYTTPYAVTNGHAVSELYPPGSNETLGGLSDGPSSNHVPTLKTDLKNYQPQDWDQEMSPTSQYHRISAVSGPGMRIDRRNFSGVSSTSTIDMQIEAQQQRAANISSQPRVPFENLARNSINTLSPNY